MAQIKNKKFDIVVGIPTYNEADSISNTVSKIDRGLFKYFPKYSALIVNMNSQSTDGTNRVFLNTKTKIEKMTLSVNRQPRGKGANIFALLKLSKKLGAKYIATIDADITTITEKWPKLLLDPIVKKKADFIAPIYTRNRYEGNTTNHFCLPLLYAWFGRKLNQPIGGDFAFNHYLVDYILKQQKNKNAFLYGIDIFLSAHALGGNFRIKEEYLGRKIHKPSFDKIIPMFQQVAATTLFVLSKYRDKNSILKPNAEIGDEQRTDSFIRKPEHAKIENLKKHAFQSLQKLSIKNIQKYLGLNLEKVKEVQKSESLISEKEWVKILDNVSKYIVEHKIGDKMADDIATTISPFFFLRVIAYFEELDKIKNQKDIDALIFKQAKELRYLFTHSSIAIDFNKERGYSNQQHSSFQTKQKGGGKMRKNAWETWYPKKEDVPDEDMPVLEKIFRENNITKILDVGCGTGRHTIYFAERGFTVFGFDFAPDAIKRAKEKIKERNLRAHLRIWDARKRFPYRDESFDAVLSIRVFHHEVVKTIKMIVDEFSRVLKKGGYIYVQVPTRQRVLRYARKAKQEGKPQIELEKGTCVPSDGPEKGVPHHGFTQQELRGLFGAFRIKSLALRDEHYNLLAVKK